MDLFFEKSFFFKLNVKIQSSKYFFNILQISLIMITFIDRNVDRSKKTKTKEYQKNIFLIGFD